MELTRRRLLMTSLFGGGLLGLRSLATGIPLSFFLNPRRALASPAPMNPQYILLNTSERGDPLNANVPGTYLSSAIGHPQDPRMSPTQLTLAGAPFTAALPWTQLPQALLDRTCFFHHATYTVVHADEANVLALGGATAGHQMFASLLASQLAPALGTVQTDPIVLGPRPTSEDLYYSGGPEPIISPSALASLLAPPQGPLGQLTRMRDQDLDSLNALVKAEGNPAKSAFIDRYALSQQQVRALSEDLLSALASIPDNGPASQVTAAIILIRMNVSPVVSINIPFGGDNHGDPGLGMEVHETVSGTATLGQIWTQLTAAGLQDKVSFLSLNVFGRTLSAATSANGRQHNANHHVAVMFGAPFRGGVIGGIEPVGDDLGATSISSATGAGVPNGGGDIPFAQTMQSMAKTFGTGVGVSADFLQQNIMGGQSVPAALAAG
jgi:hypothetical protein